jgi:type I restriction enzyme S subunit
MSNLGDVLRQVTCIPIAIPDDWSFRKLTDVCSPKQWRTVSSSEMTESGYPVFGANGFVGFYPEYNHADETIAITCRGNTCGTINRIPPKTYITGNSMALDNVESEVISQNYLYYALKYRGVGDSISGSAQPQITGAGLRTVEFPAPPLPEQKKIAAILTSVDEVIEKTRAQIDKLKDLKTSMMQELLTKGIGSGGVPHTEFKDSPVGRIPAMWQCLPLSQRVTLIPGYAFSSNDFVEKGVPLIRMGNLYQSRLDLSRSPRYLPEEFVEKHPKFCVYANDIVFSMTGTAGKEDYGFAVQIPKNLPISLLNQRVAKIVPNKEIAIDFLLHLLHSRLFLDEIYTSGAGTKQANLSSSNILSVELPFPPIEEQLLIANSLTSISSRIRSLSHKLIQLNRTKKALMQDLLTGKVRVQVDALELAEV